MGLFDELDATCAPSQDQRILRAPFPYPGGKYKSLKYILNVLPYRKRYIEVFGGSGAVILAREPSKLDVYNDINSGVVAFYRCLQTERDTERLITRLQNTVYAREEFVWCHNTWDYDLSDNVEVAARWFYMIKTSFASLGRHFGRNLHKTTSGKLSSPLSLLPDLHQRFQSIIIEHLDWTECITDYDYTDSVFYLDPPYLNTDKKVYKNTFTRTSHERLLETVFKSNGFFAISSYRNDLYESYDWNEVISWEVYCSMAPGAPRRGNGSTTVAQRKHVEEVLYIRG